MGPNFYKRLRSLFGDTFPKKCAKCGRVFESLDHFLLETRYIDKPGNVNKACDESGKAFIVMYRNCTCGSTMMDIFNDRRDTSEAGEQRRREFDELLALLVESGFEKEYARVELRKAIRGEQTDILNAIEPSRLPS